MPQQALQHLGLHLLHSAVGEGVTQPVGRGIQKVSRTGGAITRCSGDGHVAKEATEHLVDRRALQRAIPVSLRWLLVVNEWHAEPVQITARGRALEDPNERTPGFLVLAAQGVLQCLPRTHCDAIVESLRGGRHAFAGSGDGKAVGRLDSRHACVEPQTRGVHVLVVLFEQGFDLVEDHYRPELPALADDVQQPGLFAIHELAPEAPQAGRGQLRQAQPGGAAELQK